MDSQQWQYVNDPITLEERPGIDFEKIQRRRGLLSNLCKGEPPYGVDQYILRGNEVG